MSILPEEDSSTQISRLQETYSYSALEENESSSSSSSCGGGPPHSSSPLVLRSRFGRRLQRATELALQNLDENKYDITYDYEDELDVLAILTASECLSDDGKRNLFDLIKIAHILVHSFSKPKKHFSTQVFDCLRKFGTTYSCGKKLFIH